MPTYSDMRVRLAEWADRHDASASIPQFISMGQRELERRLRIEQMKAYTYLPAASGGLPAGSNVMALPTSKFAAGNGTAGVTTTGGSATISFVTTNPALVIGDSITVGGETRIIASAFTGSSSPWGQTVTVPFQNPNAGASYSYFHIGTPPYIEFVYLNFVNGGVRYPNIERLDASTFMSRTSTAGAGLISLRPRSFMRNGNLLVFDSNADLNYDVELGYYAAQPQLSADADVNIWTNYPFDDVLLLASTLQGMLLLKEDDAVMARWEKAFEKMLQLIATADRRESQSGESRTSLITATERFKVSSQVDKDEENPRQ
jgi:hypothetical protein